MEEKLPRGVKKLNIFVAGGFVNPNRLMSVLENRFKQDLLPTQEELKGLLELSRNPQQNVREKALLLLLDPPVSNESAYYRWLVPQVIGHAVKVADLPEDFLDIVCEIFAFLDGVPESSSLYGSFERVIKHLPEGPMRRVLGKAYSVKPFLPHLIGRFFKCRKRALSLVAKRRLRIFRKLLVGLYTRGPSYDLTLSDLQLIRPIKGERRKSNRDSGRGRWRILGRTLLLPCGNRFLGDSSAPIRDRNAFTTAGKAGWLHQKVYLPGLSKAASLYLEKLLQEQAKELASVRDLALQASQKTRRVVLSLHNASLAAAGGWAFECLVRQFPSTPLWLTFRQRVKSRLRTWRTEGIGDQTLIQQLADLWEQRLIHPKLIHILWESRIRAAFDDSKAPTYRKNLRVCRRLLDPGIIEQISQGKKYGWHGAVSPHQRLDMNEILRRRRQHRTHWRHGMMLLTAMLHEGQKLLDENQLPHLVLPWIDKFFISSRRDEDLNFLPALVSWIAEQDKKSLILLWEDTFHERTPSLQLSLNRLKRQGFAYRGIGVFDSQWSSRSNALQIICDQHRDKTLFALRPRSDDHYTKSFFQLLEERDYEFFQRYDSAWKDDLAFIYTGTQVSHLLSVRCGMEVFPSWVVVAGRKRHFGCWFRQMLRAMVLGESCEPSDRFSIQYSRWANLC